MRKTVVHAIAKLDELLDEVLYRPAVVKAFVWLPRWWLCDLAKLSIALDRRWNVGYWNDDECIFPGAPCDACGRRASIHVCDGLEPDGSAFGDYLETHPVRTCGWCHLRGPLRGETEVREALAAARHDSIAWRWTWRVRP